MKRNFSASDAMKEENDFHAGAVMMSCNKIKSNSKKFEVPSNIINVESSSSSESSCSDSEEDLTDSYVSTNEVGGASSIRKLRKVDGFGSFIPSGFLTPISSAPVPISMVEPPSSGEQANLNSSVRSCRQFWKAGDYDFVDVNANQNVNVRMDHARVHPKFLHSNATSHKWALGAFAELLDNAIDEVPNGATFVNVDVLDNKRDGSKMLLIEDDGGGMSPVNIRHCMSLGFSAKSKSANTIGQYGNGFKTSTMRLGADVIVFSRCLRRDGKNATQSIGLLSYTFLRTTGKEDIFVPLIDYEKNGLEFKKMVRSTADDWDKNLETIIEWSPFTSEKDLLHEFDMMPDHGTRIIIYNLWEDDQGMLELDLATDPHDIYLRGINRDEKKIQMAQEFPNSKHFLTYQHSLRSYSSILYLRYPSGFRIILRGKDVHHHNIVDDMMLSQEITYKPQINADGIFNYNITAVVTIGFVKDAEHHIDVQGFNVYHKNRLIKPFWRLWNPAGSDGRGVIGVLEANFVEPAHDKQGFERTTILGRLETRLVQMQKQYWASHCHLIGYTARRKKMVEKKFPINDSYEENSSGSKRKRPNGIGGMQLARCDSNAAERSPLSTPSVPLCLPALEDVAERQNLPFSSAIRSSSSESLLALPSSDPQRRNPPPDGDARMTLPDTPRQPQSHSEPVDSDANNKATSQNKSAVKQESPEAIHVRRASADGDHPQCADCQNLKLQLKDVEREKEELKEEQKKLLSRLLEERKARAEEVEFMRKKYKDASSTIQQLLDRITHFERTLQNAA